MTPRRLVSPVLFAAGVALVLIGMSAAQGWSAPGIVASVAAIAALLYVGGVWFGRAAPSESGRAAVMVFDANLRLVSSPRQGEPVVSAFPAANSQAVKHACASAMAGEFTRVIVSGVQFSVVPVRAGDGRVILGMIVTADAIAATDAVAAV
jgi:hypothetical protein